MRKTLKIFKALSDPTRVRILMLLIIQELCVCELVFILKMEQSRISHQLRILRDADLVEDLRQGKWITYRIPEIMRNEIKSLLGPSFGGELKNSKEIRKDQRNLQICMKKQIRERNISKGQSGKTHEG